MKKVALVTCLFFAFICGTNAGNNPTTTPANESITIGVIKNNIAEITYDKTKLDKAFNALCEEGVVIYETSIFFENSTYTLIGKAKNSDGSIYAKVMVDLSIDDHGQLNVNRAPKKRVCVSVNGCIECINNGTVCVCSYSPPTCGWKNWGTDLTLYDLLNK